MSTGQRDYGRQMGRCNASKAAQVHQLNRHSGEVWGILVMTQVAGQRDGEEEGGISAVAELTFAASVGDAHDTVTLMSSAPQKKNGLDDR